MLLTVIGSWTAATIMSFAAGVQAGDHVSLLMENHLTYFVISWGALRCGAYLTCINRYLTAEEAAYIVNDSEAQVVFASANVCDLSEVRRLSPHADHFFAVFGAAHGWHRGRDAAPLHRA